MSQSFADILGALQDSCSLYTLQAELGQGPLEPKVKMA